MADKATTFRLKCAAKDANDMASALLATQGSEFNKKGGLYADVKPQYLHDGEADRAAIFRALGSVKANMAKDETGQDLAVILFSGRGNHRRPVLSSTFERIACAAADSYMQLAIYLIGALFTPSDPVARLTPCGQLFTRIRGVIKDRFADPDFGPSEVAAEAGISLRYLQKLFTARNSTCSEFIYSLRLDHAARLLQRRALLNTS